MVYFSKLEEKTRIQLLNQQMETIVLILDLLAPGIWSGYESLSKVVILISSHTVTAEQKNWAITWNNELSLKGRKKKKWTMLDKKWNDSYGTGSVSFVFLNPTSTEDRKRRHERSVILRQYTACAGSRPEWCAEMWAGGRIGCLPCTANLQCLNNRNSWDSLARIFYCLSKGIIHLPSAHFFDSFQVIYRAVRSVFLRVQNLQNAAEGQDPVERDFSASYTESYNYLKGQDEKHEMDFEECKISKSCYPLPSWFY